MDYIINNYDEALIIYKKMVEQNIPIEARVIYIRKYIEYILDECVKTNIRVFKRIVRVIPVIINCDYASPIVLKKILSYKNMTFDEIYYNNDKVKLDKFKNGELDVLFIRKRPVQIIQHIGRPLRKT